MARELLARGMQAEVVEGSPLLAAEARERHPGLVVHRAMFEDFAPGPVYDAVLALHVMEHVDRPRDSWPTCAAGCAPGGAVVVVVPNRESLHRRLAVRMGLQERLDDLSPRDHLVGHLRVYGLDTLGADLAGRGLPGGGALRLHPQDGPERDDARLAARPDRRADRDQPRAAPACSPTSASGRSRPG